MTSIREYVADHEGSHGAAAAVLGLRVLGLRIEPDGPDCPWEGITYTMYPETPRGWRKRMIVILAPLIQQADWPTWPLRALASRTDERILHALAGLLDLDRREYQQIVDDTLALCERREFKILKVALSHAAMTFGPVLSEPILSKLTTEFAMIPDADDDLIDAEVAEVFAHERARRATSRDRESRSDEPLRSGVTLRELDHAVALWRLARFEERWGHSVPASLVQSPGPLTREELISERALAIDVVEQRRRAERVAVEYGHERVNGPERLQEPF